MLGIEDLVYAQFSKDAAARFRRVQLRGTIEQMRIMLVSNTFFAPMLSFQAWNQGINTLVILWTAWILGYSWWLLYAWYYAYQTDGRAAHMRRFVIETGFNAGSWVLGFAMFYPVVGGDQKPIVAAIMAGCLALGTVGFSRAPLAAFAYVSVLTLGNTLVCLASAAWGNNSTDYLMAFLSFTAGLSIGNAALERAKASLANFRNVEKLSEKTEVIDLLLKDYEAQTTEWLWQTSASGKIVSAPLPVLEMLGLSEADLGKSVLSTAIASQTSSRSAGDLNRLLEAFETRTEFHDIQLPISSAQDGCTRWIAMKGRPQFVGERFRGYRGIFADATTTVEAEQQVQFLAKHDGLTELLNRTSLLKHLMAIKQHERYATGFLIDLDGFKQINDSYGHLTGDRLLQIVAHRLMDLDGPDVVVSRLGGDEFFILRTSLSPIGAEAQAQFAGHIVSRLSKPYSVDTFNLHLSASVGIACLSDTQQDGKQLLRMADLALYEAKRKGRNRFEFFDAALQNAVDERIAITEKLKLAIRDQKIVSHYQPQHDLATGRLIGFEALARWEDDELGPISPEVFITIAEQTGLIDELGQQLLLQSCRDAFDWSQHCTLIDPPIVSINLSPVQFARADLPDQVRTALELSGLPSSRLEVEVTEGVLIADRGVTAAKLREISKLGVSIALDDFGTGYSSLSYLKDLPLNRLKIDRSFVFDLATPSTRKIVETVVHLGHSLGLSVIAEGIEDQGQVATLARLGCEDGQGFLYGRAMPFSKTATYLAQHQLALEGLSKDQGRASG